MYTKKEEKVVNMAYIHAPTPTLTRLAITRGRHYTFSI